MSNGSGFSLDFSDFEKGFNHLVKNAVPPDAEKGLFEAAAEMLRDAKEEVPKAPFKEGHLWGSTADTIKTKITHNEISVECGFNIEYAAKLHEMPKEAGDKISWSLPGSGPKYLETKMVRNKQKYMEVVAESIRGG